MPSTIGGDAAKSSSPATRRARRPGAPSNRRNGYLADCLAVLVYLAIGVFSYWHMWSAGLNTYSFPNGDQYANMWYLTWVPTALQHGLNPLFSSYLNYPHGVNLLVNTSVLPLGLLMAPVTLLSGPIAAFNVMLTLSLAASAASMYFVARHWCSLRFTAFVAGLLYGFSPYEIAQGTGHLNLCFVPLPPLMFYLLYLVIVDGRTDRWIVPTLSGSVVLQFFLASEVLASTLVLSVIGIVVLALANTDRVVRQVQHVWKTLVAAAVIAAALLAYPVFFMLKGPGSINGPIQPYPQAYRADLLGAFVPSIFQAIAPDRLLKVSAPFSGNPVENGSYLGIPLAIFVVVSVVVLWRRRSILLGAFLATVAYVLSLGSSLVVRAAPPGDGTGHGVLPGWILAHLPVLKNMIPGRYSLYVVLFVSIIVAYSLEQLFLGVLARRARFGVAKSGLVVGAVIVVIGAPVVPAVPYVGITQIQVPTVYRQRIAQQVPATSVALTYPYPTSSFPLPLVWQSVAHLRFMMPGGNLIVPKGPGNLVTETPGIGAARSTAVARVFYALQQGQPVARTPSTRTRIRAEVRAWNVKTILADPAYGAAARRAESTLVWLFGTPSTTVSGTVIWKLHR